jgi:hypothetical protein
MSQIFTYYTQTVRSMSQCLRSAAKMVIMSTDRSFEFYVIILRANRNAVVPEQRETVMVLLIANVIT